MADQPGKVVINLATGHLAGATRSGNGSATATQPSSATDGGAYDGH
jgi:hypothetical protein